MDFEALLRNYRPYQFAAPTQPAQPQKKGGRGGTLTSLISEGGAIGGGALGASIGTGILPGIGTLLGGALGAGIGAFTGRVAENKVRDDRYGFGDAAKEGALSAALGGGPLRLAKAGITAGKAVKGGTGLAEALKQGGQAGVDMSLRRSVGNKLSKSGEGLIAKEFRLNPTQQANFKKLTGEEAVSVLRRYGVKKPEDLQASIKPLQDAFDGVVDNIPAATKKEVQEAMQKIYKPLLDSPVLTRQQLGQSLKSQADAILKKSGAQVSATELNTLRKAFDDAVSYTQKGTNEFTVNKKSADAIRKLLQQKADEAGITVDGRTFKDIGLELRKLRNLDDIVGKQSYLGTGSLPLNLPNLLGAGVGGAAGGIPGVIAGGVVSQAVNSTAGRRLAANAALKSGERLAEKGANANPYGVKALTGRIAPVGLAGALADAQSSEGNNMATTAMTSNATTMPTTVQNIPGLSQPNVEMSTGSNPFAPENLQASIQQILANGGSIDDATKFIGLAKALQELGSTGQKPLSAEAAKIVSNAQTGIQALQDFQNAIDADPSVLAKRAIPGRGVAGGLLGGALGTRSADAAAAQIVDIIARLRTGAAITNSEAARFETFIPQAFDPPEVRNQKINYLMQQFQMVAQRGMSSQPGNLEEALMSQGAY